MEPTATRKHENAQQMLNILNDHPDLFNNLPDLPDIDEIFPSEGLLDVGSAEEERKETPILDQVAQPQATPQVGQVPVQPVVDQSQPVLPWQSFQPFPDLLSPRQQGVPRNSPSSLSNAVFNTPSTFTDPLMSQVSHYPARHFSEIANQVTPYADPLLPVFAGQKPFIPTSLADDNVNNTQTPRPINNRARLNRSVDLSIFGDTPIPEHLTQNGNSLHSLNTAGIDFESMKNNLDPTNRIANASSQSVGAKRSTNEPLESEPKRVKRCEQNETLTRQAGFKGTVLKVSFYEGHALKLISVEDPKPCQTCGKRYATVNQLKKHIKASHSNRILSNVSNSRKESYPNYCARCDKWLKNQTNLRRHISNVHNENSKIYCDNNECSANFSSELALVIHKRDSHGIMPASREKKQRSQQKRIESGDLESLNEELKVYVCGTCNDVAESKGNMMRHIRINHLRVCDFTCDKCNAKFRTKSNLQAHQSSKTCMRNAGLASRENLTRSCEESEPEPVEASQEVSGEPQQLIDASQEASFASADLAT